ncbi:MAG: hypothetical protein H6587_09875 [Flavobacteriales bacterium]|nr:hypothetical protein [Flavobacteriales bacterium]
MKEGKSKNNRLNNILKDLNGSDENKITTAIKQLRKHGNAKVIEPLLDKYIESKNDIIKEDITSLLFDLKDESAVPELISVMSKAKFIKIKPFIISIFWQAAIDSSNHISILVKEAIKGDYMTCVEVLTVVESYDASFNEEEIEDLKFDLDEAIEEADIEKQKLLITIKSVLENLNIEY